MAQYTTNRVELFRIHDFVRSYPGSASALRGDRGLPTVRINEKLIDNLKFFYEDQINAKVDTSGNLSFESGIARNLVRMSGGLFKGEYNRDINRLLDVAEVFMPSRTEASHFSFKITTKESSLTFESKSQSETLEHSKTIGGSRFFVMGASETIKHSNEMAISIAAFSDRRDEQTMFDQGSFCLSNVAELSDSLHQPPHTIGLIHPSNETYHPNDQGVALVSFWGKTSDLIDSYFARAQEIGRFVHYKQFQEDPFFEMLRKNDAFRVLHGHGYSTHG